jgi:hypothetical protein
MTRRLAVNLGPDEERVWQRERTYWDLFCQGDPACLALLDDGFLGWPHTADGPQDKAGLVETLDVYRGKPVLPTLELVGLSVVDPVAVVHLLRTVSRPGVPADAKQVPLRVLHSWLRRAGEWYLVGGMGHQPREH